MFFYCYFYDLFTDQFFGYNEDIKSFYNNIVFKSFLMISLISNILLKPKKLSCVL